MLVKSRRIDPGTLPFEVTEAARDLGEQIRQLRIARRWTQADLAGKAEVSDRTLVKIEAGHPSVQLGHVLKVLWALNALGLLKETIRADRDSFFLDQAKASLPRRVRKG